MKGSRGGRWHGKKTEKEGADGERRTAKDGKEEKEKEKTNSCNRREPCSVADETDRASDTKGRVNLRR
jgi:hypothetical protein